MYSVILASFLVPAVHAPAFGQRHGCHGWGGTPVFYPTGYWGGCFGSSSYPISYGSPMGGSVISPGGGGGGGAQGIGGGGGFEGGGEGGEGPQAGGSQRSDLQEVKQAIRELRASIQEIKKEQTQQRTELLKIIAEELRSRATDQALNEIRRDIEQLKRGTPRITPTPMPLPPPLPVPAQKPGTVLPSPRSSKLELRLPARALLHVNHEKAALTAHFVTPALERPPLAP